ncbi:MAG: biopolymer transporter ExbD [Planctomycetaceae bacterium]|nr:biopolymer transporter ExbD [Planctomycetaceae bacterium]
MKLRHKGDATKIEAQMAPMIDIVFQLLIFFMLTLKILAPEGDFNINMPIGQAQADDESDMQLDIKVRLLASPDGTLKQVALGTRQLGNDERVFDRLNSEIITIVGRPGAGENEVEVEIDADYGLHYGNVIQAISACTGKIDPITKKPVRYVEKIKFAKPRPPGDAQ